VQLAERLAARTLELVDIPSVSRDEAAIADHLGEVLAEIGLGGHATRVRNALATHGAHDAGPGAPLVLLVGHTDTVPPNDNLPGRISDGRVHGLGSTDMKGALAVVVELLRSIRSGDIEPTVSVDVVLFDREEVPLSESGLTPMLDGSEHLRSADLAVVMEPTGDTAQFGCLGNLSADVTFTGASGHTARPWLADNAVHKGILALQHIAAMEPKEDEIDGLVYREVLSVTRADGGRADNVVPDHFRVTVNLRYSPRRSPSQAVELLAELIDSAEDVTVRSNSPGAMPCADDPLMAHLRRCGGLTAEPKQAWTDVAQFSARGVPALNYGPGDPHLAHTREESVSIESLVRCHDVLAEFLTTAPNQRR